MEDLKSIIEKEGIKLSGDSFGGDLDPMCNCCENGGQNACEPGCQSCDLTTY